MKKIILIILAFIFICFLIPIMFTSKPKQKEEQTNANTNIEESITNNVYNYKDYQTLKLLHSETGEVEELQLDEYLYGVVASEMPASFEEEALKAQALVARTYTIYTIVNNRKHQNADICDNPACCQAWISKEQRFEKWEESERESNWRRIVQSVNSTQGKIVTYDGQAINAFFHSNSGGKTEQVINVWGGSNYPYLQSVETSGEEAYSQYNSEVILSKEEVVSKIKEYHNDIVIDFNSEKPIQILEYTDGNRVKAIRLGNLSLSGVEVRTIFGLKSAKFTFEIIGDNIKFDVVGYGHGVGMSQTGADSMAKQGSNYQEIIKHFYTGVDIVDI